MANVISVSDPGTVAVYVEADGVDGMVLRTSNVFAAPADPGAHPDTPYDCLGDEAAVQFATGTPSAMRRWFVRMEDPWTVESVGERYFAKLGGSLTWGPEDWNDARNEWDGDRAAATVAATAALTSAVVGTSCTIDDVIGDLPLAVLTCTVADAEALWLTGPVDCMELDDVTGYSEVHADGSNWLADRGASQFLPNPYTATTVAVTAGTGYTPGEADWLAVVAEAEVPGTADLLHPGLTDGSGASRMFVAEGCTTIGTQTRCDASRASGLVDPGSPRFAGGNIAVHSLAMMGQLIGSTVDGQDGPVTSFTQFQSSEPTSALSREMLGKTVGLGAGMSKNYSAFADRMRQLRPDVVNVSQAAWVGSKDDCDGNGGRAEAISLMFEAAVPFFGSAGNYDDALLHASLDAKPCNIGRPNGAIASFVSAGLKDDESRWAFGSHADRAGRRSIVDVSTQAVSNVAYGPPGGPVAFSAGSEGTSLSSPPTASLAMIYRHHYESLPGNPTFIRTPDVLYTRLLLNGDATGQSTSADTSVVTPLTLTSGYDENWGAGRLNLDPVLEYDSTTGLWTRLSLAGRVCVGDDEEIEIELPEIGHSGMNELTFVARFHDSRHARNGHLDEIELQLAQVLSPSTRLLLPGAVDTRREEKLRVRATVPNGSYVMRLHGVDVDAGDENPTCGVGKRAVFFAYRWE